MSIEPFPERPVCRSPTCTSGWLWTIAKNHSTRTQQRGSRTTSRRGTPALDLRNGIACQLRDLGVEAIDIDPRCTVDDTTLYSHRRDAPTGRLASLIWMESR